MSTPERRATARDAEPRAATSEATPAGGIGDWLRGAPLSAPLARLVGLYLPAIVLAGNMWHVRAFTIDDAYISFRYARNLAHGLGLVYNPGERVEGYTNFLWTLILAGGIRLGIDPVVLAKVLGAACAFGALAATYAIAARLRPFSWMPCVATWLLASTISFTGWSVFGLETSLFVLLVLLGTWLFFREVGERGRDDVPAATGVLARARRLPLSGAVLGLAGLTRPEAPMFLGLLMIALVGRRLFSRENLVRGALFALPVGAHLAFRHAYYGTWLPNTLGAKTGDLAAQLPNGWGYVEAYAAHAGPVVYVALLGVAIGVVHRRREALACALVALGVVAYIVVIGGDWMPMFRFFALFEPFCFLLVDLGARAALERRDRVTTLAFALFALVVGVQRYRALVDQQRQARWQDAFWRTAAGGTAAWLRAHGEPGAIALGDIGYVGYATDYPVIDLLGLVDPVIAKLPGSYAHKLGPGFLARFFDARPRYFLLISSDLDCRHPSVSGSQVVFHDARFRSTYDVAGKVPIGGGFAWCIYERR